MKPAVFISYAHRNRRIAIRLAEDLERKRISYWIDRERLEGGDPLLDTIQAVLRQIRMLVLLWSRAASRSRYVKSEWQAAYHLNKRIIPCMLDDTKLPPFLLSPIFCDFHRSYERGLTTMLSVMSREAKAPPKRRFRRPAPTVTQTGGIIREIYEQQCKVLDELGRGGPATAAVIQDQVDPLIKRALRREGKDADILNLAAYHEKNAYLIKYWDAIQAREARPDPLLEAAESLFQKSLAIRPSNASALNGLGSIFMLRRDLDAAEFFVRRALDQARKEGFRYEAAEEDLRTILRLKQERQP
jgi:hypothetical protein